MEEHIIEMARAHARIMRKVYEQTGTHESQSLLNGTMTQIIDLIVNDIPTDALPDEVSSTWYSLYHKTFWETYNH